MRVLNNLKDIASIFYKAGKIKEYEKILDLQEKVSIMQKENEELKEKNKILEKEKEIINDKLGDKNKKIQLKRPKLTSYK